MSGEEVADDESRDYRIRLVDTFRGDPETLRGSPDDQFKQSCVAKYGARRLGPQAQGHLGPSVWPRGNPLETPEVMSEEQLAHWCSESESAAGFPPTSDELRREVARRRNIVNFRRLQLVCDGVVVGPDSSMDESFKGDFFVLLRPYADVDWYARLRLFGANNHFAEVVHLLEQPLNPDAVDTDAWRTLLHFAAAHGNHEAVRCLLEVGANKDPADRHWCTPLHFAALNGGHKVVQSLLEAGADKDLADVHWRTPLHHAAENGHHEVVRSLLEAGADKDLADEDWCTPLHVAAGYGHAEVVQILLEAGAAKDLADVYWYTPLHHAAENGHHEVVRSLLEAGADKDLANEFWCTPLHVAAKKGRAEVVQFLLESGADKDLADVYWYTPLHYAANSGCAEVVQFLLEAGADKDLADESG